MTSMAILASPSIQAVCLVLAEHFWEGFGITLLLKQLHQVVLDDGAIGLTLIDTLALIKPHTIAAPRTGSTAPRMGGS